MRYRVIQWATGGVGRAAIQGVAGHPEIELVGCRVHGRATVGRDAGEIAGIPPLGVSATRDDLVARRWRPSCASCAAGDPAKGRSG